MNILINRVPESVEIDGTEFQINTDFRTSIKFESVMADSSLTDEQKIFKALTLYYPKIPINIQGAIEKMLWFYSGGHEEGRKGVENSNNEKTFDYNYDADILYAAFLSQYGIDLNTVEYLHWWKFKALFRTLKDDNEIVKIMGYRAIKITNEMSKQQRKFYSEMKRKYALPKPEKSERQKKIEDILLHGGDLKQLE